MLNLYCPGEGTPSVIFETFGHTAGYSWAASMQSLTTVLTDQIPAYQE